MSDYNTNDNLEHILSDDFFSENPTFTHFYIDADLSDLPDTKTKLKEMGCIWSTAYKKYVAVVSYRSQVETLLNAKQIAFLLQYTSDPFVSSDKKEISIHNQIDIITEQIVKEDEKITLLAYTLKLETDEFEKEPIQGDVFYAKKHDGYELYKSIAKKKALREELYAKLDGMHKVEIVKETIEDFNDDGFFTLEEALQMPDKVWLIDQILGRHDIGMIYGASGAGKTFITLDLIMSACTGTKFAESFDVKEKLNVAYCAGEGKSGISSRLSAVVKKFKITPSELTNFTLVTWVPQLYLEEEKSVHEFISRWNRKKKDLDLLVIDTFHTATVGAEENSTKDMGKILHSCRLLTEKLNCAVLLVHHSEKTGSSERGNGSLRCGNDFVLEVKKGNLICSKLKDGDKWESIAFQLKKMESLTSVSVEWLGKVHLPDKNKKTIIETKKDIQEKTILEDKSEEAAIKKVLNLFESKKGQFFTSLEIAEFLGSSNNCKFSNKVLNQINDSGLCITSKEFPSKPISSSNRTTYAFRDLLY